MPFDRVAFSRPATRRSWFMSLLIAALVVAGIAPAANASGPTRAPQVIGGSDVTFSDIPWQALFLMNDETVCGGTLVAANKVVSAAHCFTDFPQDQVKAWIGISRMEDRSARSELVISSITVHPEYNPTTFANDIAVVTLAKPVDPASGALTIGLPSQQDPSVWPTLDSTAVVSGWGELNPGVAVASNQLQAANVEILAAPGATECGLYGGNYIPSMQVCAGVATGGVDACEGDSGGPLTMFVDGEPVLAGISSTGFECAAEGYPGLYVRTTSYLPWLASNGIDVSAPGGAAPATVAGSDRDGVPANFAIGQTYDRAVFADYAGLSAKKSRLKVTSGKACTQVKQAVRIDGTGKCRVILTQGKKKKRLVVTVYST